MAKLLEQVRDKIRVRLYSLRTEHSYLNWIRQYIIFHNSRHPSEMGATEVSQFLSHLARDRNVAASTQNQALSAILFPYRNVLEKAWSGWRMSTAPRNHPSSPLSSPKMR
jgi:site-specific recombinase XerD